LEEQLRIDAMQRKRDGDQKQMGANQQNRPQMDQQQYNGNPNPGMGGAGMR